MEVGVKTPQDPKKWSMVPHLLFFGRSWVFGIQDIISSISTISFIHICNMNDINNNIVRMYHKGGAIMVNVVDVIYVADMDEAYGTDAADDE